MGGVLGKVRSVCTLANGDPVAEVGPFVSFVSEDLHRSVKFARRDWNDMGKPDVVTLTVEPGNLLNDE